MKDLPMLRSIASSDLPTSSPPARPFAALFSLRAKSMLGLAACIAVILLLAVVVAMRALRAIEVNLGSAYARNATQYNKQRILTPVLRELALAERLADSEATRQWLRDEGNPAKRSAFFAEAERYRRAFSGQSFFVASAASRAYYFSDGKDTLAPRPRYTLERAKADDAWFFSTMERGRDTNLNVDRNSHLNITNVWFNIKVKDRGRDLGLIGTGLDLTTFLRRFIADHEAGVTPMIVNRSGAVQAHPDPRRIDYASINNRDQGRSTLGMMLGTEQGRDAAETALHAAEANPEASRLFWAEMDGRPQLFAVSFIPELGWHVVTAVDLKAARLMDTLLWRGPLIVGGALLLLLGAALVVMLNRVVLRPLERLTRSARSMAAGDYSVSLPGAGSDEIGELTRAFDAMATRVRAHTEELEGTVRARTAELQSANHTLAAANKTVADSIQYASLIQNAILPDRELERTLPNNHFVLWQPRDVVGGDHYIFRSLPVGCLVGIVDCAGHGVAGALMAMTAHTALNAALEVLGPTDPAALLTEMDRRVRAVAPADGAGSGVAANMDVGLAWLDRDRETVTYAGARTVLFWSDGESLQEVPGEAAAVAGRRMATFRNRVLPLPADGYFYLTTDGYLDQAGGPKGFGYGDRRFADLLRRAAVLDPEAQRALFQDELVAWQGNYPQRDDITVLAFRHAPCLSRSVDGSRRPVPASRDL